jgi:hypothetical protein
MHGPAKNRLHSHEEGWLTLLIGMRLTTRLQAQEAQSRGASPGWSREERNGGRKEAEAERLS